jgi:hypothetical protein
MLRRFYPPQQVPYRVPPLPEEEEVEEVALSVEEYQPWTCRRRRPSDGP